MTELYYAIGAAALMAFTGVLIKIGVRKADADVACGIHLIAYMLIGALAWKWIGKVSDIQSVLQDVNWQWVLIRGVVIGAALMMLFRAFHCNNLNKVVPIFELSLVVYMGYVAIVRPLMRSGDLTTGLQSLDVYQCMAVILLLVGIIFMAARADGGRGRGGKKWLLYGLIAAVIVGVNSCYQGNHLLLERALGWDRMLSYVVATILVWVVVLIRGKHGLFRNISFGSGILLCLSGVTMSGVVMIIATRLDGGQIPVTVSYFGILAALLLGSLLLKEKWTRNTSVGLLFMVASFIMYMI